MAAKTVLEIEVNDKQFADFQKMFNQFKTDLRGIGKTWKTFDDAVKSTRADFRGMSGSLKNFDEAVKSIRSLTRSLKSFDEVVKSTKADFRGISSGWDKLDKVIKSTVADSKKLKDVTTEVKQQEQVVTKTASGWGSILQSTQHTAINIGKIGTGLARGVGSGTIGGILHGLGGVAGGLGGIVRGLQIGGLGGGGGAGLLGGVAGGTSGILSLLTKVGGGLAGLAGLGAAAFTAGYSVSRAGGALAQSGRMRAAGFGTSFGAMKAAETEGGRFIQDPDAMMARLQELIASGRGALVEQLGVNPADVARGDVGKVFPQALKGLAQVATTTDPQQMAWAQRMRFGGDIVSLQDMFRLRRQQQQPGEMGASLQQIEAQQKSLDVGDDQLKELVDINQGLKEFEQHMEALFLRSPELLAAGKGTLAATKGILMAGEAARTVVDSVYATVETMYVNVTKVATPEQVKATVGELESQRLGGGASPLSTTPEGKITPFQWPLPNMFPTVTGEQKKSTIDMLREQTPGIAGGQTGQGWLKWMMGEAAKGVLKEAHATGAGAHASVGLGFDDRRTQQTTQSFQKQIKDMTDVMQQFVQKLRSVLGPLWFGGVGATNWTKSFAGITPGSGGSAITPRGGAGAVTPGGGVSGAGGALGGATPFTGSAAANIKGEGFKKVAPRLMRDLQRDFGISRQDAAAIVGNLAHESAGFTQMQEQHPLGGGRGGLGYAQWTGPRRKEFEALLHGRSPADYQANYEMLKQDLGGKYKNAIAAMKRETTVEGKTVAFERIFEGAGVKSYGSRISRAKGALELPEGEDAATAAKSLAPLRRPRKDHVSEGGLHAGHDRMAAMGGLAHQSFNPMPQARVSVDNQAGANVIISSSQLAVT